MEHLLVEVKHGDDIQAELENASDDGCELVTAYWNEWECLHYLYFKRPT